MGLIYRFTVSLLFTGASAWRAASTDSMSLADIAVSFIVTNGALLVAYNDAVQGGIYPFR